MKKVILGLLIGGTIGIGIASNAAHASGYWDIPITNRGILFTGSPAASQSDCAAEQEEPCSLKLDTHQEDELSETGKKISAE